MKSSLTKENGKGNNNPNGRKGHRANLAHLCMAALVGMTFASCSTEDGLLDYGYNDAVTFSSSIHTRATGTKWTAGDKIGVFMLESGTPLGQATANNANAEYQTSGDGNFTPSGNGLHFPANGSVDFVAYYPYQNIATPYIYKANISDQSKPESIDLMFSDNIKNASKTSGANVLKFEHQLASLTLTISSTDGLSLDGMTATINNTATMADFDLAKGAFTAVSSYGDIKMNMSGTGTTLTAKAFIIPNATLTTTDLKPLKITLTAKNGKTKSVTLEEDSKIEKGKNYTYTVSVKGIGENAAPKYNHWTETPTITAEQLASQNLKYITHYFNDGSRKVRNYSMLFDTDLKISYWVAYPLCNYYTKKNTSRTDDWNYDPAVDEGKQAFIGKGYSGSRYDRGHQIPSADRLVTREANAQTFYSTNMTPQIGEGLNQSVWAQLEDKVRGWSSNIDTLYVVTGAMPTTATDKNITYARDAHGGQLAVPKYYFKALAKINRQTGEATTVAFKYDQTTYPSNESYTKHMMSVKDLEKLTGFTFFPSIDAKYKETFDAKKWN